MKNLVMQTAHATCVKGENEDKWVVKDNEGNIIFKLDADSFEERSVLQALKLAKMFELKAYNDGIDEGIERQKRAEDVIMANLKAVNEKLAKENERLANALDKHL